MCYVIDEREAAYLLPLFYALSAGAVNAVTFHPKEPIIASGGSDKRVILGELAPVLGAAAAAAAGDDL